MGTDSSNPYYDVNPSVGKNKCTISSALAKKVGLQVGSKLVMADSVTNVEYAFTVDAIVPYESSPYAFMDIGSIVVDGMEIGKMNAKQLARYRKENLGFVFQLYSLLPDLTVRENIQICENISQNPLDLDELLQTLGLAELADRFPGQLSGGQQQRCAIARALVKNPKLLLCDEPTGALDSRTSSDILVLLEQINQKYGATMLMVTHNQAIADMAHRVIIMHDGMVEQTIIHENPVPACQIEC